ncbi:MAG: RNA methyltransferase [Candidatus Kapabacteria bacterium]|nr:RNA methyltransferase [Candidatus Kapabacteria bacterium]
MLETVKIDDLSDPRISLYKNLRFTPKTHQDKRLFIAEGKRLVNKLLKTQIPIYSIFATDEYIAENEILISNRINKETVIYSAEKKLMERIVGFRLHTGVMALAYQPEDIKIGEMRGMIVATNGINNAENIGSIVRNMIGFGIDNIIVDKKSASPYLRRAVRVSMGSIFFCNVCHSDNLTDDINILRRRGYKIVSFEISDKSKFINEHKFDKNTLLIFGSEDKGIEEDILELSDITLKIPMSERIDSFNVASSSAVVFYEISKMKK